MAGQVIDEAIVRILPDFSAFDAEYAARLRATTGAGAAPVITPRVNTSAVENDVLAAGKRSAAGFTGAFAGIGKSLLMGAGIVGVVEGVKSVVEATDRLKEATDAFRVAARNAGLGDEAEQSLKRVQKAGVELGFTADKTTNAYTILITRFRDTAKASELLAGAEDYARLRHLDLSAATDRVSRAALGNTRALKDLGVVVPETATAAEKLAAVQDFLARMHGQAATATESLGGQVDVLQARFLATSASIGEHVGPALGHVVKGFADMGPAMDIAILAAVAFGPKIQKSLTGTSGYFATFSRRAEEAKGATMAMATSEERLAAAKLAGSGATQARIAQLEQEAVAARATASSYNGLAGAYGRGGVTGAVRGVLGSSRAQTGLALGATLAGSYLAGQGGGVGVAGGALTGAGAGFMVGGPWGAAAGAVIGAVTTAIGQQHDEVERLTSALSSLGDEYKRNGTLSKDFLNHLLQENPVLRDIGMHADRYGTTLGDIAKATASQDPGELQGQIDKLTTRRGELQKERYGRTARTGGKNKETLDNLDDEIDALKKQRDAAQAAAEASKGLSGAMDGTSDAAIQEAQAFAELQNAIEKSAYSVADPVEMYNKRIAQIHTPQMQVLDQMLGVYDQWKDAQKAVADAQENQGLVAQQVADANVAAARAVVAAQENVTAAHRATADAVDGVAAAERQYEQAQRGVAQAEDGLNQARKEALKNIQDLARQVRDIGDTEEGAQLAYENARRQARQAGIDVGGGPLQTAAQLARRSAAMELSRTGKSVSDQRLADQELRMTYGEAAARGVEGAPGVVSARQSVADAQQQARDAARGIIRAQQGVTDARRNEEKAIQGVDDALHQQQLTQQAGNRQMRDAADRIQQANDKLGDMSTKLAEVEAANNITTQGLADLKTHADAVNRQFAMEVTDNGTVQIAKDDIKSMYDDLTRLAAVYGVNLPGFTPSPPPEVPITRSHMFLSTGGPVDGWSPHDAADNIPAWLTAEEYVINARSARKHRSLLHAINADRYADGGLVLPMDRPVDAWQAPGRANIAALMADATSGTGNANDVMNWLKTTVDPLPYVFGGTGPGQYDCSSLVGTVWARLTGQPNPYRRWFSTREEGQFLTEHGFHPGHGKLTVGWNDHHTMGVLNGMPFEAANEQDGIVIGRGTSNVDSFPNIMGLDTISGGPIETAKITAGGIIGDILRSVAELSVAAAIGTGGDPGRADSVDADVARIAAETGRAMGGDSKAMLALFEAGLVESGMRNLDYGSGDSLGFLQQRPSQGWPSPMNVATATRSFLRRAMGKEPWGGSAGSLAQAVQVSAYPEKYDQRQAQALELLHRYGFDRGGWLMPGPLNHTGRPEAVLTPEESAGLKAAVGRDGEALSDAGMRRLAGLIAQALAAQPGEWRFDDAVVAEKIVRPEVARMLSMPGVRR